MNQIYSKKKIKCVVIVTILEHTCSCSKSRWTSKIFAKLNTIYFLSFTGKSRRLRMLKSCLTKSVMIWISECVILDMYTVLFDMSSIIGAVTLKGHVGFSLICPLAFKIRLFSTLSSKFFCHLATENQKKVIRAAGNTTVASSHCKVHLI